jgi:hypothetical protein
MINLKPRAELRLTTWVVVVTAVVILASVGFLTPTYLKFRAMSWDQMFRTEGQYRAFMQVFVICLYGLLPAVAVVFLGFARVLCKCRRLIPVSQDHG